jgi:hypothetical protein
MRNRLILAIVQIHPSWFALISTLVDGVSPSGPPSCGCWANSLAVVTYTGIAGILAHISNRKAAGPHLGMPTPRDIKLAYALELLRWVNTHVKGAH